MSAPVFILLTHSRHLGLALIFVRSAWSFIFIAWAFPVLFTRFFFQNLRSFFAAFAMLLTTVYFVATPLASWDFAASSPSAASVSWQRAGDWICLILSMIIIPAAMNLEQEVGCVGKMQRSIPYLKVHQESSGTSLLLENSSKKFGSAVGQYAPRVGRPRRVTWRVSRPRTRHSFGQPCLDLNVPP